MKKVLFFIVILFLAYDTAHARNPRIFNFAGQFTGNEIITFKAGTTSTLINIAAGGPDDTAAQIAGILNSNPTHWSASSSENFLTATYTFNPNANIKTVKRYAKSIANPRCPYIGHRLRSSELLELIGMPQGGSIAIIFSGNLGTVTCATSSVMTLEDAMTALENELNLLISNPNVSFGVDVTNQNPAKVYMPLINFSLIGEDVGDLSFQSTDPGLILAYAVCPADLEISCQGTKCSGGGVMEYQYKLQNMSSHSVTLTQFYLGTEDPTYSNYSNWYAPTGFSAVVGDWATLNAAPYSCVTRKTTNMKTPHGAYPPTTTTNTAGGIFWAHDNGTGITITSGNTVAFAFTHANPPVDVEWVAQHPPGVSISYLSLPVAGPVTYYNNGLIHTPSAPPKLAPILSETGIVILSIVLITLGITTIRLRRQ